MESVAEGLCDIFSRTGIPSHILTDQGSVFTSKLMKQLCGILEIKHLKIKSLSPPEQWLPGKVAFNFEISSKKTP